MIAPALKKIAEGLQEFKQYNLDMMESQTNIKKSIVGGGLNLQIQAPSLEDPRLPNMDDYMSLNTSKNLKNRDVVTRSVRHADQVAQVNQRNKVHPKNISLAQ